MSHVAHEADQRFRHAFEACEIKPEEFDHAAHVRLAYVYLCDHPVDEAVVRMKQSLLAFLPHIGVGESKYHETVTRAWVMAVKHFMSESVSCNSAADFISASPQLLDSRIMLTHYSAEVLFSPVAREAFVEPDVQEIPKHEIATK